MRRGSSSLIRRFFSSTNLHASKRTPRFAIVGSGPAGFYSAQYLLKNLEGGFVDMFEKYPVPFGLVRFGVAPDHPEVKNVIHSFTTTAKTGQFRFLGGVTVGSTVTVSELLSHYHAVILAYGAGKDRLLNVSGEDSPGVYSARDIVGWYNGLPDNAKLEPDLFHSSAVIIGQGNVAVDVARMLLSSPDALAKTDITQYALDALRQSRVQNVYLVGRRGPAQVAFTIREFRELTKLADVNVILDERDVEDIKGRIAKFPKQRKRLMQLMIDSAGRVPSATGKNCYMKFLSSPKKIVRSDDCIQAVNFTGNILEEPNELSTNVISGDIVSTIKCGLVIRSIGYEAVPICPSLPFDKRKGVIPNDAGRVDTVPGLYCSGWIKRGPVGVILTTMNDAYETVDALLEDVGSGKVNVNDGKGDADEIVNLLAARDCCPVGFEDWERIDAEEVRLGQMKSKPREKLVDIQKLYETAFGLSQRNSEKII